ncbi:trypsin-like serine peptidase [Kitasatospora sp. NPDC059827]|uniref:trypsin-like serine peptidase n=1 Tax=Kitasatospora sp. NPDC059827 TaxID=3346964 RepID=UPI0036486E23
MRTISTTGTTGTTGTEDSTGTTRTTRRTPRTGGRRAAAAGAALLAALTLTATACAPDGPAAPATPPAALPKAAPTSLGDLSGWKLEDWARYVADSGFANQVPPGYWTAARTEAARARPTPEYAPTAAAPPGVDRDAPPAVVQARPQPHPYGPDSAVVGRLLMTTPQGDAACSGTVVADPLNPGRSNLVLTAAHCLHDGRGGGWVKNLVFVPAFNRDGRAARGKPYDEQQAAPYGRWTAVRAMVSPTWLQESGVGAHDQYDYGIVRVRGESAAGPSLEEAVGGSVPVWFNAPREQITSAVVFGYPVERPFDGMELERCDSPAPPGRLSFDRSRPPMYAIGCSMTGGAGGGGWFITRDGRPNLVSVSSLGSRGPAGYRAGPSLQDQAKQAFDYFAKNVK